MRVKSKEIAQELLEIGFGNCAGAAGDWIFERSTFIKNLSHCYVG